MYNNDTNKQVVFKIKEKHALFRKVSPNIY